MRRAKIELYRGIEMQRFHTNTIKQETVAPMESAALLRTGENKKDNCTSTGFQINNNTWNV